MGQSDRRGTREPSTNQNGAGRGAAQEPSAARSIIDELCTDLAAERADLDAMIAGCDETAWQTPTPAPGWSVLDQITHLAYFDDAAREAIEDPAAFQAKRDEVPVDAGLTDAIAARYRSMGGDAARRWLGDAGAALVAAALAAPPKLRIPWFGPDMSLASALTARLMETWAHGQDVADALGIDRRPNERLRHVAFLGVRALPNSFVANGLDVPAEPVRVELTAPDGSTWAFGPNDAAARVTGPALDFCLLVTQRCHRDDTALVAEGATAARWLDVAQAFAGPPGPGRAPQPS